jgi:glycosyltransferase involved in cell wall biosynthesis
MKITIFLMCYNEELFLLKTIKHYRDRFPNAKFVLVDNYSKDDTCKIATENGIEIRQFDSGDKQCEEYMMYIRNNIWNDVTDGWVIMCDMDEWLDITEEQLKEEEAKGVTIITTKGINIVADSKTIDLSDIDLYSLDEGVWENDFSKRVLFKVPDVRINYWWGAHQCFPEGNVKYSENEYVLKHMNYLGADYLEEKHRRRYERNEVMRNKGMNVHYFNERDKVINIFNSIYEKRVKLSA